ncbi:MAG: hypothetical protein CL920_29890 [Deltaproteobacteria bacterium]|nr:hypothetical protein [Deltaproteobacteria bacterium]|tara:strand:- start:6103 stop:7014 length:912 start_codon:yes stop_codon:yes gene_type:complete
MKRALAIVIICMLVPAFAQSQDKKTPAKKPTTRKAAAKKAESVSAVPLARVVAPSAKKGEDKLVPLYQIDSASHKNPPAYSRLSQILNSQVLRVCVRADIPPFGYLSGGKLTGFDIHLARLLGKRLSIHFKKNLHISWKIVQAKKRVKSLLQNRCDFVVASFSKTAKRAKQVGFSRIYYKTDKVLIERKPMTAKEPVIAVVRGTTMPKIKGLKGTVVQFNDYNEIIFAMSAGEIDYAIADQPIGIHMIRSSNKNYRIARSLGQAEMYGVGVNKSNTHLLKAINAALLDLANSGELAYLQRQWL